MFDANAAHIPNGQLFFAEVHSTNEFLLRHNIKQGDILLCEHVIKSGERSRLNELTKIWTTYKGEVIEYRDAKIQGLMIGRGWFIPVALMVMGSWIALMVNAGKTRRYISSVASG